MSENREGPIVWTALDTVETVDRTFDIYDQPIGLRALYEAGGGAEHHLVRYPGGMKARWHRHSAAHTIVLLEGRLSVNGQVVEAPAYCHYPANVAMLHEPAGDGPCLFVILFDAPFDLTALDGPGV